MTKNQTRSTNLVKIYIPLFCIALAALLLLQIFNRDKIAYIDSGKIYSGYKGIVQAKAELEKKAELYKSRVDTLTARIKLDIMKIDELRAKKMPYAGMVDSIQYHKKQLSDYQSAMNESLKKDESTLTQNAMIKLNAFLKTYGEAHGYDMILIANPSGTIAYAKDKYDITAEVLKEVNEKL